MAAPESEKITLDLLEPAMTRRRARWAGVASLLVGAALGGVVGLLGGRMAGLLAAVAVAVPLLLLTWGESRRRVWLSGQHVSVRVLGTRVVDLHALAMLDLVVTDTRGTRVVGLLVRGGPKGKTINVALASYAGTGGRELGVFALRRLADVLAGAGEPRALVYSELLVAQLRAEARGEPAPGRPLFQLASVVPPGKLARRLHPDAVTRFVATLG
ncbi:MAG: hypothetical protein JOZ47_06580 [Kutzneria sp.]|nr:hypothetical protein [Kutzneria sp.]